MKTTFHVGPTRYVPGKIWGRESNRGWGRIKRTLHRQWTQWTWSHHYRAWVLDGRFFAPIRATKAQITEGKQP